MAQMKYGVSPRSGNLVKVVKVISRQPVLFRCQVIAGDRIYYTNYSKKKLLSGFDPVGPRKYKIMTMDRRQLKLEL